MQTYDSGTLTMTGATHTLNTTKVSGKIIKVQIVSSASNTFKLWVDASDTNTKAIVDEYVIGASGSAVTVAASLTIYPAAVMELAAGTGITVTGNTYDKYIVDDVMEVAVASGVADDTFRIVIWYDDLNGRALPRG